MQYRGEMSQELKDRLFFIEALKSNECRCGRRKQAGRAVCYKCWVKLPEGLRRPLYNRIGAGFEEAYEEACKYLEDP